MPPARSSSQSRCADGQRAADAPGDRRCRAPPTSRPSSTTAYGRTLTRELGIAHGVVVAAHVVHAVAEPSVAREERLVLLGAARVGEVALHHDRRRDRAASISSTTAPFITSGYGGSPGAHAQDRADGVGGGIAGLPALGLAEVHVVGGGDGREEPPGGRASVRTVAGSQRSSGTTPSTSSVVLGVGFEPGDPRVVERAVGRDLVRHRPASRPRSPGAPVNVTTTSSGPTLMSSAWVRRRTVRRGSGARCARRAATGPAAARRGATGAAPRAPTRGGCRRRRRRRPVQRVDAATAARIAATSSRGRPPARWTGSFTGARSRACATASARAWCAASPATAPAPCGSRAGR